MQLVCRPRTLTASLYTFRRKCLPFLPPALSTPLLPQWHLVAPQSSQGVCIIPSGRKTFQLYACRCDHLSTSRRGLFDHTDSNGDFPAFLTTWSCIIHSGVYSQFPPLEGKCLFFSNIYSPNLNEQMIYVLAPYGK